MAIKIPTFENTGLPKGGLHEIIARTLLGNSSELGALNHGDLLHQDSASKEIVAFGVRILAEKLFSLGKQVTLSDETTAPPSVVIMTQEDVIAARGTFNLETEPLRIAEALLEEKLKISIKIKDLKAVRDETHKIKPL